MVGLAVSTLEACATTFDYGNQNETACTTFAIKNNIVYVITATTEMRYDFRKLEEEDATAAIIKHRRIAKMRDGWASQSRVHDFQQKKWSLDRSKGIMQAYSRRKIHQPKG